MFFAFIGFDVVATASEETKNPHKNVPLGIGVGMLLIIVMYMLVAVVTTGMVSYADLAKQDSPSLATAFELVGADWAAKIISFGIVLGLATVVMVLLLGLTRIVFAMSRDGLLPRGLSKTGKHGTPAALQIVVGAVVALVAAFFDIGVLSDMVNIGTLSAFTLVAISIPIMRKKRPDLPARLQDARQPVDSDPHRRGQLLVDAQPVRAHLDSFRGVARGRLRHLLRLRLLACAPRQGRPDRNAVRRNR